VTGRGATPAVDGDLDLEATVRAELARAVGTAKVERYEQRLRDASRAFEAERFTEALRLVKKLADEAPGAAAVRELHGLTLYRLGRWRAAAKELEAFRLLSSSTEQHPVLADCYRALGQYSRVEPLWDELREASPSAELVTEGRIVMAGTLADQGEVRRAITLLEQGFTFPKRPKEHHLRRAYALADCYERAGDVVRARELFARVAAVDAWFADARQRERALS
jgi:tetratricopeptide (TPR) repeat protein